MTTVHEAAKAGFGEGTNAAYDAYRPTYPVEQLDVIQSALAIPSGPLNVLELGAGTGIFTRRLLAHKALGPAIASLRAIDPSSGMRAQFEEGVKDPRVSCHDGTFDDTGASDGWADMVVIAQAWHWCPDHDAALTEISRVLKPNGVLVLIWNLQDETTLWVAQLRQVYAPYDTGLVPQYRRGTWRGMYDTRSCKDFFDSPCEREITWIQPMSLDTVVNRVFTTSFVAVLPDEKKAEMRKQLVAVVEHGDGMKWVDESKGIVENPYHNLVVIIRKKN